MPQELGPRGLHDAQATVGLVSGAQAHHTIAVFACTMRRRKRLFCYEKKPGCLFLRPTTQSPFFDKNGLFALLVGWPGFFSSLLFLVFGLFRRSPFRRPVASQMPPKGEAAPTACVSLGLRLLPAFPLPQRPPFTPPLTPSPLPRAVVRSLRSLKKGGAIGGGGRLVVACRTSRPGPSLGPSLPPGPGRLRQKFDALSFAPGIHPPPACGLPPSPGGLAAAPM